PDQSVAPRWEGTEEISYDFATTVGVVCPSCQWNYQGPDWVKRLGHVEVSLVLVGATDRIRLAGDQTATILVGGLPMVGVDSAGAVGLWPDGGTWHPLEAGKQPPILQPTSQPRQAANVIAVEVDGAVVLLRPLAATSTAELRVNRVAAAYIAASRPAAT